MTPQVDTLRVMEWGEREYSAVTTQVWGHSLKGRPCSEWQSLFNHSRNVAIMSGDFARKCLGDDMVALVSLAGWLHDIGKARNSFQQYLYWANGMPSTHVFGANKDHPSIGATMLLNWFGQTNETNLLIHMIAGHHGGLRDSKCNAKLAMNSGYRDLSSYVNDARSGKWGQDMLIQFSIPPLPKIPDRFIKRFKNDMTLKNGSFALFVRICQSCLVDADCLDTQMFMDNSAYSKRGNFENIDVLRDRMMEHLNIFDNPQTAVNKIRCDILRELLSKSHFLRGVYSVTIPTGGGKTLSGLAWGLSHACTHEMVRIISMLPYTTTIEQNTDVYRRAVGESNVVEHHSVVEDAKNTQENRLASDNWDAPCISTTNVQFLESIFCNGTARLRKLHNIAHSVIIMDECQTVPPQFVAVASGALSELVEQYGCSILLSTATQPSFPGIGYITELISNPLGLAKILKRVEIHWPQDIDRPVSYMEILDEMCAHPSFLCIVNKRAHARDLYDGVLSRSAAEGFDLSDVYHLSARMSPEHRLEMIGRIKAGLRAGRPIRVVATQLVEAGVDFDFPVVFRAFAGLESIWQAAGRCNREGLLPMGHVYVFLPEDNMMPGTLGLAMNVSRNMLKMNRVDFQNPCTFVEYFKNLYGSTSQTVAEEIRESSRPKRIFGMGVQFVEIAKKFQIVDDESGRIAVFIPRGKEGVRLMERLYEIDAAGEKLFRSFSRRLQRFTVLTTEGFEKLGVIDTVCVDKNGNGIRVLNDMSLYSEETGIDEGKK